MITINLRPGQKRKSARLPLAGVAEQARALASGARNPVLILVAAAWVGTLAWLGWVYASTARELHALEPKLEQTRDEHRRFKTFLAEKRRQEAIRDSLVRQIGVIRRVDGDRYIWPHILDEVTRALPPYTWLVDLGAAPAAPAAPTASATQPAAGAPAASAPRSASVGATVPADSAAADIGPRTVPFQINGRTVDIQAYTKFLRQLEASPWISDVTPVVAQTVVEQERAVTAFTIRASYREADSAYIRTVPFSESVR